MKTVLSQGSGFFLIMGYFAVMLLVVFLMKRRARTKSEYLVANRTAPWLLTAFSMAATWVWAPSLFTASEKAYTQGLAGVFWFVVPNILTLILFAFYAKKMRKLRPEGWTFSYYIQEKYSNRAHNMFLVESFGLQICSFAVQLLAGASILHAITGLPFFSTTVLIAVIPFLYTFTRGIRSSIATDFIKMGFIVLVLVLGIPIIASNVGWETISNGLGGISGEFGQLFHGKSISVMLSFGIPTTIGLLSGTFGDQMFWQRVFSVRKEHVSRTIVTAAFIFGIVPISLSMFGFFAAGSHLAVADTQLTNVSTVVAYAPKWFLYFFFVVILSGLTSTVDSILCALSSIAGQDVLERIKSSKNGKSFMESKSWSWMFRTDVSFAKVVMFVVMVLAIIVANIPGLKITYLFLFYGTLRSSVMLPTIFAIRGYKMSERGLFYGILVSLLIGLPVFAIGQLNGNLAMILTGSLFTILASGIISLLLKDKQNKRIFLN